MFLIPMLDSEKKRKEKRNTKENKYRTKKKEWMKQTQKKQVCFSPIDIIGICMQLHLNQQSPTIDVLSKQWLQ